MVENRLVTSSSELLESSAKAEQLESGLHESIIEPQAPGAVSPGPPAAMQKAEVERLIAREYFGLRLLIARRTGDPHVAADLLNDAVCTTWEKWLAGKIARPDQIAGYIFQVAMNLLRNRRRAMAERPEKRADADVLESMAFPDSATPEQVEANLAARVKEIIRGMGSQRDRTILVRFYLNEEDKETICRDLKLTPIQFARVLHRARGRLRQLLESHGFKGSDLFSALWVM
jgi:RNA polymerase sigma-70 factor (ECF subfamily)